MDVLYFIYIQYYSKLSRETGKCFQEKPGEGDIVKNLEIFYMNSKTIVKFVFLMI